MRKKLWLVCLAGMLLVLAGCAKTEQSATSRIPARAEVAASQATETVGSATGSLTLDGSHAPIADLESVPRISVEDLKDAMNSGSVAVVDVRNEESWEAGHIPGAKHIPIGEIAARSGELPRGRMIVTYCT